MCASKPTLLLHILRRVQSLIQPDLAVLPVQVRKAFNLDHGALTEHAEKVAPGSEGVNFLPYLTGVTRLGVLLYWSTGPDRGQMLIVAVLRQLVLLPPLPA